MCRVATGFAAQCPFPGRKPEDRPVGSFLHTAPAPGGMRSVVTRRAWIWLVLLAGPVLSVGLAVSVGPVKIPPARVVQTLISDESDEVVRVIIRQVRLPRALLAGLAGAGLAAAGAAFQGLFRNPLADPYLVGSASGAAVGATLVIALGGTASV